MGVKHRNFSSKLLKRFLRNLVLWGQK